MAGTLRDIKELEAEIEAGGFRSATKQQLLDLLKSQSKVGGVMSINDSAATFVLAGGFNRIDTWERSIDTTGVKDGLTDPTDPGGWYKINNAAAGDYNGAAFIRFTGDKAGDYEIRITHVMADLTATNTPYHDKVTIAAGGSGFLCIGTALLKNVGRDERLQLGLKGPNGAIVNIRFGQFGVQR